MIFKKEEIVDERVVNLKNKIYKEAFFVAQAICVGSIIIKFYLYGMDTQLAVSEFTLITISLLYAAVRTVSVGLYSDVMEIHDRKSKVPLTVKNVIFGLGAGIAIAVFFGIKSSVLYGGETNKLWYFILVFLSSILIYVPFFAVLTLAVNAIAKRVSAKAASKDLD